MKADLISTTFAIRSRLSASHSPFIGHYCNTRNVLRLSRMGACRTIPSENCGESVHAVVVLKPNQVVLEEDLIAHCKALIANYKCPRSVEVRAELPLSDAGKIQKNKLRKPHWAHRSGQVA